jgi:hypothetical protein
MLREAIVDGRVPLEAKWADEFGNTMVLEDVSVSIPELAECNCKKFSSRLSSLRKTIKEHNCRADLTRDTCSGRAQMSRKNK